MWSLACMVFELVTGDYLFHPLGEGERDKDMQQLTQVGPSHCRCTCMTDGALWPVMAVCFALCAVPAPAKTPGTCSQPACTLDTVLRLSSALMSGPLSSALPQMVARLGDPPTLVATTGAYASEFFNREGKLRQPLHPNQRVSLDRVLVERYGLSTEDVSWAYTHKAARERVLSSFVCPKQPAGCIWAERTGVRSSVLVL